MCDCQWRGSKYWKTFENEPKSMNLPWILKHLFFVAEIDMTEWEWNYLIFVDRYFVWIFSITKQTNPEAATRKIGSWTSCNSLFGRVTHSNFEQYIEGRRHFKNLAYFSGKQIRILSDHSIDLFGIVGFHNSRASWKIDCRFEHFWNRSRSVSIGFK